MLSTPRVDSIHHGDIRAMVLAMRVWSSQASAISPSFAYAALWSVTTGLVAHFGIAATMVMGRSMMADVTDEDTLQHGRRREGIFFGAISFSAKAAFGVGGLISGFVIDLVGLVAGQDPATVSPEIVSGLGMTLCVAIGLLCGGSLLFFSRYGIDRARYEEISAALEARGLAEGS